MWGPGWNRMRASLGCACASRSRSLWGVGSVVSVDTVVVAPAAALIAAALIAAAAAAAVAALVAFCLIDIE